ncbi:hypothetical protein [Deinococcus sp. QL22]|uniref:hypothetical protein n=1 Tax=Deinococcus sp. QL22 TaxID=2939437 RepID=UPI00201720DF|nr:hypothetical protein [Deinococcus sp. QL22]UQN06677.1 hypothetical protein M1R55_01775 [Deinococcus sp. QL22]
MQLADSLAYHPDLQTEAWAAWQELMGDGSAVAEDEAQYWLDVEFVEPCPEHC